MENRSTARFCDGCGVLLEGSAALAEARKVVTILFCDVVGSTELGERLDPEVLRATMRRYFAAVRPAIERHGGTLEKFIGDAVVAVFGVPRVHEDDALRAARAAHDLCTAVERVGVAIRVGVSTGEAMVGSGQTLGSGDVFNTAARLQQAAVPGTVLLSSATYELVRDAVVVEPMEPFRVKGKRAPITAWRLVEVIPGPPTVALRQATPLVGRMWELKRLEDELDRCVRERSCRLVTVLGVAGIGKSRLVAELQPRTGTSARVCVGHCPSYGEDITFLPVAEVVRAVAEMDDREDRAVARRKLDAVLSGMHDERSVASRIARAIGLDETPAETDEVFWSVRRLFEHAAKDHPLIVQFEDVHWAEPTLLDLVEYVADRSRVAAILIVCTARPELLETRPLWADGRANRVTVILEPLTEPDCHRLLETQGSGGNAGARQRSRIVAAAEGNPLFLEQMNAMAADYPNESELRLPPTLTSLLTARLDGLDRHDRVVLECAAIEGRIFHRTVLAQLVAKPTHQGLASHLQELVRRQLVQPEPTALVSGETFRFRHQLIRDCAYLLTPKRVRADLHERFANWLETTEANSDAGRDEVTGYHLEQACKLLADLEPEDQQRRAGLAARAARLLVVAGRRAMEASDLPAAVGLMSRASRLMIGESSERCMLLVDLSRALWEFLDVDAASEVADEAMAIARRLNQPHLIDHAEVARLRAVSTETEGLNETETATEPLIFGFAERQDDYGLALAWELRYWDAIRHMKSAAATEAASRVAYHGRRANVRSFEAAGILGASEQAVWGVQPVSEGLIACRDALQDAGEDPRVRTAELSRIGALEAMRGRFEEAQVCIDESKQTATDLGSPSEFAFAAQNWSLAATLSGAHGEAEAVLEESLDYLQGTSATALISVNRDMLAQAILAQGRLEEADDLARSTEQFGWAPGAYGASWRRIRARVLAEGNQHGEAMRLASEASMLMAATDYLHDKASTELDLAIVLRSAGRYQRAREAALGSIRLWNLKGNTVSTITATALLGAT